MPNYNIKFLPDDKEVQIEPTDTVLRAAEKAGIAVKSACGGGGSCGRCAVLVKEGEVTKGQTAKLTKEQLAQGWVLACQVKPLTDLVIEIPAESRLSQHQVLTESRGDKGLLKEAQLKDLGLAGHPLYWSVYVELTPPTLTEAFDDLSRLTTEVRRITGIDNLQLGLETLKKLASTLREGEWKATVYLAEGSGFTEIADILPGKAEDKYYGLAIDIGTTTVVVYLVDLATGEILGSKGGYNKQAKYGDDVITRIVHAVEEKDGLAELHEAVIGSLNELIDTVLKEHGVRRGQVKSVVSAGNTTMTHLFLGIQPTYIRLEPYIPTVNSVPPVRAKDLGLHVHPQAWVHSLPNIASYVGGDITSGVLVTGMAQSDQLTLLIDIGTNGEMVLGNSDWLIACSCSAGPAFEGGGIKYGMRAMHGAIERVRILPGFGVECKTIGNGKPVGICGSGLIDCIATLRDAAIIDRTGKFSSDLEISRIRDTDEGPEFVLVWANDSGIGEDITISENDIKNLIRSKGAIFAGIRVMLGMVDLPVEAIDEILIAGGFGNYLNIHDSVTIGLLPDLPTEKYKFIGNSSVKGAYLSLVSHNARRMVEEIAQKMTYLELSVGNSFLDEFVSALFLPHTDLSLFPSVHK